MSLKDFGKKLANVTSTITGFGQIFASVTPTIKDDAALAAVSDTSSKIVDLLHVAEGFGEANKLSGEAKLNGIVGSVAQVIGRAEFLFNTEIIDEAGYADGIKDIVSGYAKIMKAVKKK